MRSFLSTIIWISASLAILYSVVWPVPILPESWQAPKSPGYTGPFAPNNRLQAATPVPLERFHGPEEVIANSAGELFTGTENGRILRIHADGGTPEVFADSKGRPLGMAFDGAGNLIVADAVRGLISVDPQGNITLLTQLVERTQIGFPDDVVIGTDGKIYFTDASRKFSPRRYGSTLATSKLDLMEHGGNGRLLVYDPVEKITAILRDKLQFANGIAFSHDRRSLLITETGAYRVTRYWLAGEKAGTSETVIENLPGFPDNISRGQDGRYWIALPTPRNPVLDILSPYPRIRKFIQRLPGFLHPRESHYGHIIAINDAGEVLEDLQDPGGKLHMISSVTETREELLIGSVKDNHFYRLDKKAAGL